MIFYGPVTCEKTLVTIGAAFLDKAGELVTIPKVLLFLDNIGHDAYSLKDNITDTELKKARSALGIGMPK